MSAYPFASSAKVTETLGVLETSNIATTQQTLLQQILVACGVGGTPPDPGNTLLLASGDGSLLLADGTSFLLLAS